MRKTVFDTLRKLLGKLLFFLKNIKCRFFSTKISSQELTT